MPTYRHAYICAQLHICNYVYAHVRGNVRRKCPEGNVLRKRPEGNSVGDVRGYPIDPNRMYVNVCDVAMNELPIGTRRYNFISLYCCMEY